jgi:hypothetical protein
LGKLVGDKAVEGNQVVDASGTPPTPLLPPLEHCLPSLACQVHLMNSDDGRDSQAAQKKREQVAQGTEATEKVGGKLQNARSRHLERGGQGRANKFAPTTNPTVAPLPRHTCGPAGNTLT